MATRTRRGTLASVAALAMLALLPLTRASATSAFAYTGRFDGADRFDTARRIAASAGFGQVDSIVVATGRNFPDALAGNYLASAYTSPILLTERDSVPNATVAALDVAKPKTITLLGGPDAISTAVESNLRGRGYTVDRVQGADRYSTALAVTRKARPLAGVGTIGGQRTAFLATGQNFADALAAGPVAWARELPVLLTTSSTLSPEARDGLTEMAIERVVIVGGTAAVSSTVEAQVKAALPNAAVQRLFGADRTKTATEIAEFALDFAAFDDKHFNLARGDDFADALAGGPHGGREAAPTLLAHSPTALDSSSNANVTYLNAHSTTLQDGHIFGGTTAVSQAVADAAAAAAGQAPPEADQGTATPQVQRVVAADDYFVGTNNRSYFYDTNDTFTLSTATLTLAQFESVLNPDDVLSVNYNQTPSGPSTFTFTSNVTHAPTSVAAVGGDFDNDGTRDDVRITFQIPTNNSSGTTYSVQRYEYQLPQCGAGTPTADGPPIAATTGTVIDTNLANGCYQYEVIATEPTVNGAPGATAKSARTGDVAIPAPEPRRITDAKVTAPADVAPNATVSKGHVHVFYFNDRMASSIEANGSRYRLSDPDGTVIEVVCGASGTACNYEETLEQATPSSAPAVVFKLTVTIGDAVTTVTAGSVVGAQYPATVTFASAQWAGTNGAAVDLASSPDRVVDKE